VLSKMSVNVYNSSWVIFTTSFSSLLLNGSNKLDHYITLDWTWKGLPRTNTLAYRAHSQVTKKMKCCEYGPWCSRLSLLLGASVFLLGGYSKTSLKDNGTVHIRYLCRKTAVLSCHRCLINIGVEKMNCI